MTLRNSPSAIDGARIDSATLRIAQYLLGGRFEGVSGTRALKVKANSPAGNSLVVEGGAALILNRYQGAASHEAYAVDNLGDAVIGSSQMPPSSPQDRSHLVCITVGDPEFGQGGHPWMLATDPPAGQEATFQYVRFHIIQNVAASTNHFSDLNLSYPGYALARLDIPANTTTITDAMIKDLRDIPLPRDYERLEHLNGPNSPQNLNGAGGNPGSWEVFPSTATYNVTIPRWATHAKISAFVEGLKLTKAGLNRLRVTMVGIGSTTQTNIDEDAVLAGKNFERKSYNLGGELIIPENMRGQTVAIRMEGTPNNAAAKGSLFADQWSSAQIRVRFVEAAG